jgi:hypothetical protein
MGKGRKRERGTEGIGEEKGEGKRMGSKDIHNPA